MTISKEDGWDILFKLQCEVGRSEDVEGLAAAAQGEEVEILVGERDFWELCEGASPSHTYSSRRQR